MEPISNWCAGWPGPIRALEMVVSTKGKNCSIYEPKTHQTAERYKTLDSVDTSQVISAHPQLITCITWHSSNDNMTGWSHVPFSPLLLSPSSCQSPKQLQLWAPWFGPHGMMTSHHHHHNGMMNQMKKRSKRHRHHPSLGPQVSFFISSHFYLTNNAF